MSTISTMNFQVYGAPVYEDLINLLPTLGIETPNTLSPIACASTLADIFCDMLYHRLKWFKGPDIYKKMEEHLNTLIQFELNETEIDRIEADVLFPMVDAFDQFFDMFLKGRRWHRFDLTPCYTLHDDQRYMTAVVIEDMGDYRIWYYHQHVEAQDEETQEEDLVNMMCNIELRKQQSPPTKQFKQFIGKRSPGKIIYVRDLAHRRRARGPILI